MYKWNGLDLKIPEHLVCESVLSFVDDIEEPRYGVTIAREETALSINEYLKAAVAELQTLIEDFELHQSSVKEAVGVLDFSYPDEDGIQRQRQQYRRVNGELVITSITSAEEDFEKVKDLLSEIEIESSPDV